LFRLQQTTRASPWLENSQLSPAPPLFFHVQLSLLLKQVPSHTSQQRSRSGGGHRVESSRGSRCAVPGPEATVQAADRRRRRRVPQSNAHGATTSGGREHGRARGDLCEKQDGALRASLPRPRCHCSPSGHSSSADGAGTVEKRPFTRRARSVQSSARGLARCALGSRQFTRSRRKGSRRQPG
jgi:hypothetical protein